MFHFLADDVVERFVVRNYHHRRALVGEVSLAGVFMRRNVTVLSDLGAQAFFCDLLQFD